MQGNTPTGGGSVHRNQRQEHRWANRHSDYSDTHTKLNNAKLTKQHPRNRTTTSPPQSTNIWYNTLTTEHMDWAFQ